MLKGPQNPQECFRTQNGKNVDNARMGCLRLSIHALKFLFALIFMAATCVACARLQKRDIAADLVSEMEKNCKEVEIKRDFDQGVYVIRYTGKVSKDRCPIALIQGWKDGLTIINKEVAICGCKDR